MSGQDSIRVVGARENNLKRDVGALSEKTRAAGERFLTGDGGEIVFTGTPAALLGAERSLTGEYLRRRHASELA